MEPNKFKRPSSHPGDHPASDLRLRIIDHSCTLLLLLSYAIIATMSCHVSGYSGEARVGGPLSLFAWFAWFALFALSAASRCKSMARELTAVTFQ